MPKISINGNKFHYQQVGSGEDIVMVHGITGNLAIWHLEIIPALMNDYRITTYDLRGHGYSDMPSTGYTTADHADDLKQLLEHLQIDVATLVGHSFGADIAMHYTILNPDRVNKLVVVEPAIPALQYVRDREDWAGWKYWRDKLALADFVVPEDKWYDVEYLVRASINLPKVFGFNKGKARRAAPLKKLMETTASVDYCNPSGMTLEKISNIQHDTMIVYGDESVFMDSYDFLTSHLPRSTSYLIPGTEHFGPVENPQFLLQYMRSFFGEHSQAFSSQRTANIVGISENGSQSNAVGTRE